MDFLVKLSRNQKVMVPIVIVLGLSIFGGGYLVQSKQKLARQQSQEQATDSDQTTTDSNLEEQDEAEKQETPVVNPDTPVSSPPDESSEDKESDVESVAIKVDVKYEGSEAIVSASVETDKPGKCLIYIAGALAEEVVATNKTCTFKSFLTDGVNKVQVAFKADDLSAKGIESVEI